LDTLFDETPDFDRDRFASRLQSLARRGIYIGGSSWKYEGWLGQIYTRSRYQTRGRFSKKLFEDTCLSEYASVFSTVCGDFAFYQFPSDEFWRKLFTQVPTGFQFAFKAPEQITCRIFPTHQRYGAQGGRENETFLDADLLRDAFLRPLENYRDKTALLIFEFGAFSPRAFARPADFVDRLDPFLAKLPPGFRYSVEIRNPDFLVPDYFACLRSHGVAHVYNAWTKMPELPHHIAIPDSRTAEFLVTRALLRQGRAYEDAVREFSPYAEVRDPNPFARQGLREILEIAQLEDRTAFIFINNRLEGNAPGTMVSILDGVD
jgi:uncharacterized protein YecE (DUF72 family)